MQCIYCERLISSVEPDEHVYPAAFGCPDWLVLNCVCRRCNHALNSQIEQHLINDSVEGYFRFKLGTLSQRSKKHRRKEKNKSKRQYLRRRSQMHLLGHECGDFEHIIMEIDRDSPSQIILPPQIVLKTKTGERHYYTKEMLEQDFHRAKIGSLDYFDWEIFAEKDQIDSFFQWLVVEKYIKSDCSIQGRGRPPDELFSQETVQVRIKAKVDNEILRAIAKVGYNYLAKSRGWQIALNPAFRDARLYITDGVGCARVKIIGDRFIDLNAALESSHSNHKLSLMYDWPEKFSVSARLQLYGITTYEICLASNYQGIAYDAHHIFDPHGVVCGCSEDLILNPRDLQ